MKRLASSSFRNYTVNRACYTSVAALGDLLELPFSKTSGEVVGTDISEAVVQRSLATARQAHPPDITQDRLHVVRGAAEDAAAVVEAHYKRGELPTSLFDVIIAFKVLAHIPSDR
ncbi:hypothetical protein LTS18_008209, partial [Coniosporium uncinatum]